MNAKVYRRGGWTAWALALLLAGTGCRVGGPTIPEPDYWPTTGWRSSTPEAQGIDSDKLAELLLAIPSRACRFIAC